MTHAPLRHGKNACLTDTREYPGHLKLSASCVAGSPKNGEHTIALFEGHTIPIETGVETLKKSPECYIAPLETPTSPGADEKIVIDDVR